LIDLATDLYRKQPLLTTTALIHIALAILMIVGLAIDNRTILGLSPWIKPLKFAVSIAVYLVTTAIFLSYFPLQERLLSWASTVIASTMLLEIFLISLQSLRGTTSHFNVTNSFNAGVFTLMGIAVAVNTLAVALILLRFFFNPPALSIGYLWGIRLGLIAFIIGSIQGFLIASRMAHSVGGADGGPGLPFLNWSTRHGDLRIAHFVGLHGLQIIPFVGYIASGRNDIDRDASLSMLCVTCTAGLLMGVMLAALMQALAGKPLIEIK
jgi:hypothetical protein